MFVFICGDFYKAVLFAGKAIAQRLASEGARVAIVDKHKPSLDDTVRTFRHSGYQVLPFLADVSVLPDVRNTVSSVLKEWGRVDVFVGAAGITGKTNIRTQDVDPADWTNVFNVNVNGLFFFCKELLPHMLERKYGRLVNIASVAGKEGNAGMLAYSSSKAAVIGLTKVIGKEYAETGITCNAIAPAVIQTPMVAALPKEQVKYMTEKIPMKRTGTLDEVAALACWVASPECSFTTGFCFDLTGGRATY